MTFITPLYMYMYLDNKSMNISMTANATIQFEKGLFQVNNSKHLSCMYM